MQVFSYVKIVFVYLFIGLHFDLYQWFTEQHFLVF